MNLFWKNIANDQLRDKAATKIAGSILQLQNWFAETMTSATIKWRHKQQWIFLCLICLLFGGLSILAIANAFTPTSQIKIIPAAIKFPKHIQEDKKIIITDNEFKQVQEFKKAHPDLLEQRPDITDRLSLIEQIYHTQKSK